VIPWAQRKALRKPGSTLPKIWRYRDLAFSSEGSMTRTDYELVRRARPELLPWDHLPFKLDGRGRDGRGRGWTEPGQP
jgi:hypothetical protein